MFWTGIGSFGILLVVFLYVTAGNKTPGLFLFCFVVALIIVGGSLLLEFQRKHKLSMALRTLLQSFVENLEGFCATQLFIAPDNDSMIAIDAEQKKIVIVFTKAEQNETTRTWWIRYEYDHKLFCCNDLIDVAIMEDGRAMKERWFQEAHAQKPARWFLEANVRHEKVNTMVLSMSVKEVMHATYAVNFLPLHMSIRKDSKTYRQAKQQAMYWNETLKQLKQEG